MVETSNTTGFVKAADDKEGSADEDPGPSCLNLFIECEGWHALNGVPRIISRAYNACVAELPAIESREVSLALSSDESVTALNSRYRAQDNPTNVLSFPAARGPVGQEHPPLGDIIIAYETVMREAEEENKPPLFHLAHLTVHGILHLAGFDHETNRDAERMEALERKILEQIGVPDPYPTTPAEQPVLAG